MLNERAPRRIRAPCRASPRGRYVASQPWPFPRSLMVGFTAQAEAAWGPPASGNGGSSSDNGGGGGGASGLDLLQGPARAAALGVGIR